MPDDRPVGGKTPGGAVLRFPQSDARASRGRLAGYVGMLWADAFDDYNRLYLADRKPGPVVEALCWSHAPRKFFELADIAANARRGKNAPPISPIVLEAANRIDALFAIDREINGLSAARRLAARQKRSAPLVAAFEAWMRAEPARLSSHVTPRSPRRSTACSRAGKPSPDFSRTAASPSATTPPSGRHATSALGRKSWLFAGSERGAERAALMYTLIQARISA